MNRKYRFQNEKAEKIYEFLKHAFKSVSRGELIKNCSCFEYLSKYSNFNTAHYECGEEISNFLESRFFMLTEKQINSLAIAAKTFQRNKDIYGFIELSFTMKPDEKESKEINWSILEEL